MGLVETAPVPEDPKTEVPPITKEQIGEKLNELDKELKMTGKEKDRLAECFKDKEFMGMFEDYMKEISDPASRQEYNDYIRQCEAGGDTANKIPEGMQLILPKVGFCLKATSIAKGKVFVNITHTEKLKEFQVARVPGQGENWSMPYCLDNPKQETDSEDKPVIVYTIAFNTQGFNDFALSMDPKRKEFLIAVALENIEGALKEKLERGDDENALCPFIYKEMKNLKYKGIDGKPTVLSCKKEDMNMKHATSDGTFGHEGAGGFPEDEAKKKEDAKKKAAKEAKANGKGPNKKKKGKKAADKQAPGKENPLRGMFDKPKKNTNSNIEELASASEEEEEEEEEGVCKPKYSLVHRGHFDMDQHMMGESALGAQVDSCRPRELIIKIQLPRCDRAGDVDLDVSAERLVLQVEEKYDLLLELPFPVDEENGSAKFDKTLHTMTVTLPVVKEETPVQVAPALMEVTKENETEDPDAIPEELAELLDNGDGVLVEVGTMDGGAGFTCSDGDGVLIVDGIAPQGSSDRAGVSKGMQLVAFEAGSRSWNIWQQAEGTMTWDEMYGIVANASRPWKFTFSPSEEPKPEPGAAGGTPLAIAAAEMVAGFYPAGAFSGAKERYFFSCGDQGVGYYRDVAHLRRTGQNNALDNAVGGDAEGTPGAAAVAAGKRAATPLDMGGPATPREPDVTPVGSTGLGGFENSIMLELD